MAQDWYYAKDGERRGPITFQELGELAASGKLTPSDLVWQKGMAEWVQAGKIQDIFESKPPPHADAEPAVPASTVDLGKQSSEFIQRCRNWFNGLETGMKVTVAASGVFLLTCCCPCGGMFMIGSITSPNARDSPPRSAERTASDESPSSEVTRSKDGYALGDEFQLGDYKYRIGSVVDRSAIGNQFTSERASDGATFVIVTYSIENCTNESQTVLSDDFKLIDARGRTFSPSSNANTALLMEDDKDFAFSELQPGIPRQMKTAFEVPIASVAEELTLVVPKKGFFSSGEARVRIR
jgi:hypothetical protein